MNHANKPITAVMNGAGLRGREVYGKYALEHPDKLKFIAVADPNVERRKLFQTEHQIPDEYAFSSWDKMMNINMGKIADTAFICTQDRLHFEPALRALELGYDLLLEKPISPSLVECQELDLKARETGRIVQVSHVLRYTPFFKKIKDLIDQGTIGKILDYDHSENVSYWHFGHSYVRGPYKNKESSSPMILAKSCHDLDIMHWLLGKKPLAVQSQGNLIHYKPENAPEGAPERCTDGCPHAMTCPWYAPRLYLKGEPIIRTGLHAPSSWIRFFTKMILNHRKFMKWVGKWIKPVGEIVNWNSWPTTALTTDVSDQSRLDALKTGPFGKCIYKTGNDVVDHQIATYQFPDGVIGTLRVHGFSDLEGRELRIFGEKGVIRAKFRYNEEKITLRDFRTTKTKMIYHKGLDFDAHGGGDFGLMDAFIKVMRGEASPEEVGTTDLHGALESHYMAFAAEDARISQKTLDLAEFRVIKP